VSAAGRPPGPSGSPPRPSQMALAQCSAASCARCRPGWGGCGAGWAAAPRCRDPRAPRPPCRRLTVTGTWAVAARESHRYLVRGDDGVVLVDVVPARAVVERLPEKDAPPGRELRQPGGAEPRPALPGRRGGPGGVPRGHKARERGRECRGPRRDKRRGPGEGRKGAPQAQGSTENRGGVGDLRRGAGGPVRRGGSAPGTSGAVAAQASGRPPLPAGRRSLPRRRWPVCRRRGLGPPARPRGP